MKTNLLTVTKAKMLLLFCILWQVCVSAAFAQSGGRTITGKVTDDTNEPLIGVNVLVAGTYLFRAKDMREAADAIR